MAVCDGAIVRRCGAHLLEASPTVEHRRLPSKADHMLLETLELCDRPRVLRHVGDLPEGVCHQSPRRGEGGEREREREGGVKRVCACGRCCWRSEACGGRCCCCSSLTFLSWPAIRSTRRTNEFRTVATCVHGG